VLAEEEGLAVGVKNLGSAKRGRVLQSIPKSYLSASRSERGRRSGRQAEEGSHPATDEVGASPAARSRFLSFSQKKTVLLKENSQHS